MHPAPPPMILSIAGHDPTGGAGIQADIEAIAACGGRAVTAVSALTVQDTRDVRLLEAVAPELLEAQLQTLLQDIPVQAIKIGLIGSVQNARVIARILGQRPALPVVLDPVLAAGGGGDLASAGLPEAIVDTLLPRVGLLTPNTPEARRLGGDGELATCAHRLLERGCGAVLITGTHEREEAVINRLFRRDLPPLAASWPRLPESYHGSGCTLSAAIATLLGRGFPLEQAVERAQAFTWNSLRLGYRPGAGQYLPDRMAVERTEAAGPRP
ncbi:MAG TPA: hydroxymethylpyrimidine/phosphomethylpyrimidine kinase [Sedimenticola thiotaurini]|uniref:hydroxymethylpyrimidine kinase n=1 Tax=Sedimenticola thiotaurini TaxID=1543721 RepID=A0A831RN18_9GAMM|nr:hydroxymethylpyrimidine/phosphomethylpyrimidine kinase [Sedimenticola thiotaurini]